VVEEQVDVKIVPADDDSVLSADERKAVAQFEQEFFEVANETCLEFPLLERFREREEVENVRIFERLLCQVRLRGRQQCGKVRDGFSVPGVRMFAIWITRMLRLQPLASVCSMYQRRMGSSLTFSIRMT